MSHRAWERERYERAAPYRGELCTNSAGNVAKEANRLLSLSLP